MAQEPIESPAAYTTIRVTADTVDRLRSLQKEFAERTGGTITQSALIGKGLDALEAAGSLAV